MFINSFLAKVPILYPQKTTGNQRFLLFSGDMKWEQWSEMGQELTQSGPKLNQFFKTLLSFFIIINFVSFTVISLEFWSLTTNSINRKKQLFG